MVVLGKPLEYRDGPPQTVQRRLAVTELSFGIRKAVMTDSELALRLAVRRSAGGQRLTDVHGAAKSGMRGRDVSRHELHVPEPDQRPRHILL